MMLLSSLHDVDFVPDEWIEGCPFAFEEERDPELEYVAADEAIDASEDFD